MTHMNNSNRARIKSFVRLDLENSEKISEYFLPFCGRIII